MSVRAVIFDWGGTLTPWHPVDLPAKWRAYAQVYAPDRADALAAALLAQEERSWQRQRTSSGAEGTGNLDRVFAAAGVDLGSSQHTAALAAYLTAWDPHTYADPDARGLLEALRAGGIKVGVLSNTLWPRSHHESVFARDGLLELIDGAVYTSELDSAKPHEAAFRAALDAVEVAAPAEAVFVGDRIWDDVHGAQAAGMRAMLVPHSLLPPEQVVAVDVVPDAVVQRLSDVLDVVQRWS